VSTIAFRSKSAAPIWRRSQARAQQRYALPHKQRSEYNQTPSSSARTVLRARTTDTQRARKLAARRRSYMRANCNTGVRIAAVNRGIKWKALRGEPVTAATGYRTNPRIPGPTDSARYYMHLFSKQERWRVIVLGRVCSKQIKIWYVISPGPMMTPQRAAGSKSLT
jgi:hypothetical protein